MGWGLSFASLECTPPSWFARGRAEAEAEIGPALAAAPSPAWRGRQTAGQRTSHWRRHRHASKAAAAWQGGDDGVMDGYENNKRVCMVCVCGVSSREWVCNYLCVCVRRMRPSPSPNIASPSLRARGASDSPGPWCPPSEQHGTPVLSISFYFSFFFLPQRFFFCSWPPILLLFLKD